MIKATIILKDGRMINLNLFEDKAPITVKNFVELAKSGFYKGTIFHRVIDNFMIQGGGYYIEDMYLKDKDAKTIKGEFNSNGVKNDLKHEAGVISMARTSVKDSASSQFFICSVDCPHLDNEYAAFGKVVDSKDLQIVKDIAKVKTCTVGGYFADFPEDVIEIEDVKISD